MTRLSGSLVWLAGGDQDSDSVQNAVQPELHIDVRVFALAFEDACGKGGRQRWKPVGIEGAGQYAAVVLGHPDRLTDSDGGKDLRELDQGFQPLIETLRGLLMGTPIDNNGWLAVGWCFGILTVFFAAGTALFRRQTTR